MLPKSEFSIQEHETFKIQEKKEVVAADIKKSQQREQVEAILERNQRIEDMQNGVVPIEEEITQEITLSDQEAKQTLKRGSDFSARCYTAGDRDWSPFKC